MDEIVNLSTEARDILRYHITLDKKYEYKKGLSHGILIGFVAGFLSGISVYIIASKK